MKDNNWFSWNGLVCEDEASSILTDSVLQVLPVPEWVDGFVEADLL